MSCQDFVRLGLTRAKALPPATARHKRAGQTVSRFPRETRRRYAMLQSNAFILEVR